MPYNGVGVYILPSPEYPAVPGTTILAEDRNVIDQDLKQALSIALPRDGQAAMTGNLNFGGFSISNLLGITAPVAGNCTLSGNFLATTQAVGTNDDRLATCALVFQTAMSAALPGQAGNNGKFVTTDGTSASWSDTFTIPISFSSRLNEAKGANIASAATINLTTATGNLIHITGTTTITAITIPVGAERTLIFDGALTLTHGAALLLPGAANIVTVANDRCIVRGDTAGAIVIDYIPASGRAVSALTYGLSAPLATLTPTVAANVDALTVMVAAYDNYVILYENLKPNAGTDALRYRLANAGVVDTASNYLDAAISGGTPSAVAQQPIGVNVLSGGKGISGRIELENMNGTTSMKSGRYFGVSESSAGAYSSVGGISGYIGTSAVSGIRFFWSAGASFAAVGVIRIYGYNNT